MLDYDIAWSSSEVYGETLARAGRLGLRVVELESGEDVDTPEDLVRLAARLRGAPGELCPRTRAVLAALGVAAEAPCAS